MVKFDRWGTWTCWNAWIRNRKVSTKKNMKQEYYKICLTFWILCNMWISSYMNIKKSNQSVVKFKSNVSEIFTFLFKMWLSPSYQHDTCVINHRMKHSYETVHTNIWIGEVFTQKKTFLVDPEQTIWTQGLLICKYNNVKSNYYVDYSYFDLNIKNFSLT